MSKIIPVMVHHETGEKAQAAGEEEPGILKNTVSLRQKNIMKKLFC